MPLRRLLRIRFSEIAFDASFGLKLATNLMRTFTHVAQKRHSLLLCLVGSQCGLGHISSSLIGKSSMPT